MGSEGDPRVQRTQRDVVQAAGELLLEGGWSAVTHAAVATRAGYSKATLYKHWPEPSDLGRAAFVHACSVPRHEPSGELRDDLIGVLGGFAHALIDQHIGRVLAALAERAPTDPATAELLDSFVSEGSSQLLEVLEEHGYGQDDAETVHELLSGAVVYRVMLRQLPPTREFIERIVDHTLRPAAP